MQTNGSNAPPPRTLTLRPMAKRLRVTVKWLREQAEAGLIPCLPAGGDFIFSPEAVETRLAELAAGTVPQSDAQSH